VTIFDWSIVVLGLACSGIGAVVSWVGVVRGIRAHGLTNTKLLRRPAFPWTVIGLGIWAVCTAALGAWALWPRA
jgi:hypothetical protein